MTLKGRGGAALFIAAFGSWIGGTLSVIGLMFLAPVLAMFATKFGPPEMFSIYLLAFILLSSLGTNFFKTMPMVLLGLLIACIGMDPLTGVLRFTHENKHLYDGVGFVPVAMGAFGMAEILSSTQEGTEGRKVYKVRLREMLPTRKEFRAALGAIIRGSGIGFFMGLLPGSAHIVSSFLSYLTEKRLADKPEEFGHGRIEGVAGPETANNAASGSAMIPFLGLGIPTGPPAAVMMIALLIHGVRPGPLFISEYVYR